MNSKITVGSLLELYVGGISPIWCSIDIDAHTIFEGEFSSGNIQGWLLDANIISWFITGDFIMLTVSAPVWWN